jgi:sigma-B regulation protein RsbU (phosphoserine phosphatase)
VHRDGTQVPMMINALRHHRDGVVVVEVAAYVARDRDKYERELVAARKRLEDLVAEATRLQAEAKDRAVFAEQTIGIVSHDLRNPLSTVQMAAALLGGGDLSASQHRLLGRITHAVERATRLISDLLDFTQARLGTGLTVSLAPIDLHHSIAETVEELGVAYPGHLLRHQRTGEGVCAADVNRLAQLVGNLVSNAIAYGKPGEPVSVTSDIGVETFSIAVHNHGAPIPGDLQQGLFQPMTRGDRTSRASRSVGLGLYIVSEIARAHGGSTHVTSTAEDGTTFRVSFPMRPPSRS